MKSSTLLRTVVILEWGLVVVYAVLSITLEATLPEQLQSWLLQEAERDFMPHEVVSVFVFVILQIVARYILFVSEVDIDFPWVIEIIGPRVLGFFSGFCVAVLFIFINVLIFGLIGRYGNLPRLLGAQSEGRGD